MRRLRLRALLLVAALASQAAPAAPIPWQPQESSFAAREQPLGDFLLDFFSRQGLSVTVSQAIRGTVNGNFTGPPERIFDDLRRAYSLLAYYDGAVVYVYSAREASSRTIGLPQALVPRMIQTLRDLRMLDTRNTASPARTEGLIVLNGAPRFLEQAEEVARNLQVQASSGPSVFRLFPLRYAWAHDITLSYSGRQVQVAGVATLLRSLIASPSGGGVYFDQPDQMVRPTVEKLRGRGLRSIGEDGREVVVVQEPSPAAAPAVAAGSADQPRIEADRRLNAVVVRDSKERMPYYEQLIAALDTEPQVIEIEATIVDIDRGRLRDLGVSWRWSTHGDEVLFGEGGDADRRLRADQNITPEGQGLFISTIIGDANNFVSRIHALENEDAARIVSRPQVVTLNNVEAVVESNRSFYVRIPGEFDVDLFNVVAGTSMRVTPHVLSEEGAPPRIRMLVNIEDGTLTDAQVDQIPIVDRSAINTQSLIAEGESLLIGGLVRDESTSAVTRVPFLGTIPLFGKLFSRQSKSTARVERLFMITPRLIPSSRAVSGAPIPGAPPPAPPAPGGPPSPPTVPPAVPPPPPR